MVGEFNQNVGKFEIAVNDVLLLYIGDALHDLLDQYSRVFFNQKPATSQISKFIKVAAITILHNYVEVITARSRGCIKFDNKLRLYTLHYFDLIPGIPYHLFFRSLNKLDCIRLILVILFEAIEDCTECTAPQDTCCH